MLLICRRGCVTLTEQIVAEMDKTPCHLCDGGDAVVFIPSASYHLHMYTHHHEVCERLGIGPSNFCNICRKHISGDDMAAVQHRIQCELVHEGSAECPECGNAVADGTMHTHYTLFHPGRRAPGGSHPGSDKCVSKSDNDFIF